MDERSGRSSERTSGRMSGITPNLKHHEKKAANKAA
ncbi:hypothetical protein SSTU70S_04897 [Stutzerimonas stutzeri]